VKPEPLICAICDPTPRPDENAEDDWRTFSTGVRDGVTLCPECFEREFSGVPKAD
jgi:hypothetical protein